MIDSGGQHDGLRQRADSSSVRLPSVERLGALVRGMSRGLLERELQARCALLAILCGEHLLLIGPPGTAKSVLARRLNALVGGRYFERLLTRFTVPEELFGPLSLEALDHGRYERAIDGYLPTASIAFLDEVFKANSAILNALLTILNEREFDQGSERIAVPLIALVGASNELPLDESLRAFFDRFLFRCQVRPVSVGAFGALLEVRGSDDAQPEVQGSDAEQPEVALALDEVRAIQASAQAVRLAPELAAAIGELKTLLAERGVQASDRRWVRIAHALRVSAATHGRREVDWLDLWLLSILVPERAEDAETVEHWLAERIGGDAPLEPERLRRVLDAFERQIDVEAEATEFAVDDAGKLALARRLTGIDDEQAGQAAPRMSAFSRRRRYSAAHVAARLAQIDAVMSQAEQLARRAVADRARTAGRDGVRALRSDALERQLAPLDALSRRLRLPAIVNSEGDPFDRLSGLACWRARLLAGSAPCRPGDPWPAPDVGAAFAGVIDALDLARLSRSQDEIADQVIRSALWYIDRIAEYEARLGRPEALAVLSTEFSQQWRERSEDLQQVLRLFQSLDGLASFADWTRTRGLLRSPDGLRWSRRANGSSSWPIWPGWSSDSGAGVSTRAQPAIRRAG